MAQRPYLNLIYLAIAIATVLGIVFHSFLEVNFSTRFLGQLLKAIISGILFSSLLHARLASLKEKVDFFFLCRDNGGVILVGVFTDDLSFIQQRKVWKVGN